MIGVEVEVSGLFLTGAPLPVIDKFVSDATYYVASQGASDWHRKLDQRLRNPTPYYETQIMVERMSATRSDVHDRGMIYGPWLEGTGSRNRTTSFKGYRSQRETVQELGAKILTVVAPYQELMIRRLNGG